MAERSRHWFRQAEADLRLARHALDVGHHEWACFASQQAAEKGIKAVDAAGLQEAWGHSVTELLDALGSDRRRALSPWTSRWCPDLPWSPRPP